MEAKTLNGRSGGTYATEQDIQRVFALQQGFRSYVGTTTAKERIGKLQRLWQKLFEHREDIRTALYADFRKPATEVDLTEIGPTSAEIKFVTRHLEQWMRPKKVRAPLALVGTHSEVRYEPRGVVLIIAPWNYPVLLTLGPLVSAIAAGNCAILKPSEYTPHTAHLLKMLLTELFDEREVAVLEGDAEVAQQLLALPFDHIYFTGSPQVGKVVMRAAAEHLTSITLELGGKTPALVDKTADVKDAAAKITWGKFANAGQTCIAPDYVLAHEQVYDALVEAMRKRIRASYGSTDAARRHTPDYARIVNTKHFERVRRLLEDAVQHGARVIEGGAHDADTLFMAPTLLTGVPVGASVMEEEIFGPLLPVLRVSSLDEALTVVANKPRPLALYYFGQGEERSDHVLAHTSAGGTCINEVLLHFFNPDLPFGGVGNSGIGRGHGHAGFLAFSNERAVLTRKAGSAILQLLYPPYREKTQKVIDRALKYL